MAQNQKFSQGLHKPLMLLQNRSQLGVTARSKVKLMCSLVICIFCMPANQGSLQQSYRKEGMPLRCGAAEGYVLDFSTRTIKQMKRFAERFKQALKNMNS